MCGYESLLIAKKIDMYFKNMICLPTISHGFLLHYKMHGKANTLWMHIYKYITIECTISNGLSIVATSQYYKQFFHHTQWINEK